MCHALLGEVQGHDAKESYHRRGGPSAEARQPRVLQKTLDCWAAAVAKNQGSRKMPTVALKASLRPAAR